jgi:hypothetical protein
MRPPVFGVEPRHDLERADFGFVAAPRRGERFQLRKHVLALEIAERA